MTSIFELVIIAFLLLISIELLLIYRELVHGQVRRDGVTSEKDEKNPPGQTINVNVAGPAGLGSPALPLTGGVLPVGGAGLSLSSEGSPSPEGSHGTTPGNTATAGGSEAGSGVSGTHFGSYRNAPQGTPTARVRTTNPFAKVCPHCGAENFAYRTECFNCGKSLP